jgi:hypothetical protein
MKVLPLASIFQRIEQQDKEFIKRLKETICDEGNTNRQVILCPTQGGTGFPCFNCREIDAIVGDKLK